MKWSGESESGPRRQTPDAISAMILGSASPIFATDGKIVGILYGGEVLNRDDGIVDRIRDILYRNEQYRGKNLGSSVSLFLKDIRIATNFVNKMEPGPWGPPFPKTCVKRSSVMGNGG